MNKQTNTVAYYESHDEDGVVLEGTAVTLMDTKALALLNASEIDQQIATARRYPRSLANFTREVRDLVTLDTPTAQSCTYALPRAGKTITGASVRFAEMVNYSWGNTRVATRIVDVGDEFVTVEGMFFDLEKNTAVKSEVMRRITNRKGERFDADMIQVTAVAAGSIARRNAILTGIPKALWVPMHEAAVSVVVGDIKTLANRAHAAIQAFAIFGIQPPQIFGLLGIKGVQEFTTEHIVLLGGVHTAIKEKSVTPEAAFAESNWPKGAAAGSAPPRPERSDFKEPAKTKEEPKPEPAAVNQTAPAAEAKAEAGNVSQGNGTVQTEPASGNITAAPQQEAAKDPAPPAGVDMAYEDFKKDAHTELAKINDLAALDMHEDRVAADLKTEDKPAWRGACKHRYLEISKARAGKKK